MSYIKSFVIDTDTDQPLVRVILDFGTKSPKLIQEAIDKLVSAKDALQHFYIMQGEGDD